MKQTSIHLPLALLILCIGINPLFADEDGDAEAGPAKPVFKTVDEKGKVSFSDTPQEQSTKVELRDINTAKPVKASARPPTTPVKESALTSYTDLSITSPKPDALIPNGLVAFTVVAKISPELQAGHKLQLSIDGQVHSSSATSSITVDSIHRGQHTLQLSIVDDKGKTLKKSKSINISALRPSTGGAA